MGPNADWEAPSRRFLGGRALRIALAAALTTLVAAALAPLASAAPSRSELPALSHSGFTNPCGVATDPTGDLYVNDQATGRIKIYASP